MNIMEITRQNTIVAHYAGSLAYGTNLPTSDTDIRGVFAADPLFYRTPFMELGEVDIPGAEDGKLFELNKFAQMCAECNPNIMETLWVDESDIIYRTPAYDYLRQHRADFLSRRVADRYVGYAEDQLKRIKGHNKWMNRPQSETPPRQIDFVKMVHNYTPDKVLPRDFDLQHYRDDWRLIPYGQDIFGLVPMPGYQTYSDDYTLNRVYQEGESKNKALPAFIVSFNKDNYQRAKNTWKNYWHWKKHRNEKRSALEEKFGYDTKHAAHLVRLLRMGREIITTGKCLVKRPDAAELLAIKEEGIWTYEEVVAYAEEMKKEVAALKSTSPLPPEPNYKKLAALLVRTQDLHAEHMKKQTNDAGFVL